MDGDGWEIRGKMTAPDEPTNGLYAKKQGVRGAYTLKEVIAVIAALRASKKSFRRIAKEDFGGRVSHAVIQRLEDGLEPHDPKIREALGLPAKVATVYVIGGGEIPEGAQVISANMCECGQPFISNHPRRSKCFICSPYKGRGKHAA